MPFRNASNGLRRRAAAAERKLLQLGVFRLRLREDRDVGVGVFPEREEILVGSLRLDRISRQRERSAQLQVRQCADGIAGNDPAMIENFLEFRSGFGALVCSQIGQAAHIDGIEDSEEPRSAAERRPQIIGHGDFQQFDGLGRVAAFRIDWFSARSARIAGR